MIEVYCGIPGSGKSYSATLRAIKAMKKGRPVFSNYPIVWKDKVSYKLTRDMISDGRFPEGSLLIIDEAGSWFNSRNWKGFSTEDLILFTQHRHMSYDLLLCVQHPARIDTVIREICNVFWWHRNYWIGFLGIGYYEYTDIGSRSKDIPTKTKFNFKLPSVCRAYDTNFYKDALNERDDLNMEIWEDVSYISSIEVIKTKLNSFINVFKKKGC